MADESKDREEKDEREEREDEDDEERSEGASDAESDEQAEEQPGEESDGEEAEEQPGEESDGEQEAGERADDDDSNESAERVAAALGVGEGDDAPAGSATEEEAAAPNRAARRREEALERRRKRKGGAAPAPAEAEADRPRDKNERAKELLLKRRERAKASKPSVQSALLPSEMVDDALSRSAAAFGKWFRANWNVIQWVVVAAIVGGGGFAFWQSQKEKSLGGATSSLVGAIAAERGRILEEDKRSDEEKEFDPTRIFKTAEERSEAASAGYKKVMDEHPKSGAAILARLGQAGVHLDRKQWDQALEGYSAVIASTLAAADPDVKGRAIEGAGLAKEGKGDADAALASFKELEGIDAKGFKELALYHQARLHLAKGDKEKAKELLKSAREKLTPPQGSTETKSFPFLEAMVDETLRRIDPSAVPARPMMPTRAPGGGNISPEELEKLIQRAKEAAQKGPDAPAP